MSIEAIAERLLDAQLRRQPVPAVSSSMELDFRTAYDVHWTLVERKIQRLGVTRCGYKLGMTEGAAGPVYGVLADDCLVPSRSVMRADQLMQPYVEAEIGVRPRSTVPLDATPGDIAEISDLCLVIEVPDSRYAFDYWPGEITPLDLVCDQSCVGRLAVGETTVDGTEIDRVLDSELSLSRDGEVVGVAAKNPARVGPMDGMAWLARQLAERDQRIEAGWIVSTGRLVSEVVPAVPGATFAVRCQGLGEVRLQVEA